MNDNLKTILSSVIPDEDYVSSFRDFFRSKRETSERIISSLIPNFIDTYPEREEEVDGWLSDHGINPNTPFAVNDYVTNCSQLFNQLWLQLSDFGNIDMNDQLILNYDVSGQPITSISVDELLDYCNAQLAVNAVSDTYLDVLAMGDEAIAASTNFYNRLTLQFSEITGEISSMAQSLLAVLQSKSMTIRDKLEYFLEFSGLSNITDNDASTIDITLPSVSKDYTGASPVSAWVSDAIATISNLRLDSIANALVSIGTGILNGVRWIGRKGKELITKVADKVVAATVDPDDLARYSISGDETIDSCGLSWRIDMYTLCYSADTANRASYISFFNNKLHTNKYLKISLFGSVWYFWKIVADSDPTSQLNYICCTIRWRPIGPTTHTRFQTASTWQEAIEELSNVCNYEKPIKSFDSDLQGLKGIYSAKQLTCIQIALLAELPVNVVGDLADSTVKPFSYDFGVPFPNPTTNVRLVEELISSFENSPVYSAFYELNNVTHYAWSDYAGYWMIKLLKVVSINVQDPFSFFPYIYQEGISKGSWYIKTDSDNAAAFAHLLLTVCIIATVICATVLGLTFYRQIKFTARNANALRQYTTMELGKLLTTNPSAINSDKVMAAQKTIRKTTWISRIFGGLSIGASSAAIAAGSAAANDAITAVKGALFGRESLSKIDLNTNDIVNIKNVLGYNLASNPNRKVKTDLDELSTIRSDLDELSTIRSLIKSS